MILVYFVRHRDFNEGVRQGGATQLTSFICTIQFWPHPNALSHKYCFLHLRLVFKGLFLIEFPRKLSVYSVCFPNFEDLWKNMEKELRIAVYGPDPTWMLM